MTERTPGEWTVVERDDEDVLEITCDARLSRTPIASIAIGWDGPIEAEQHANAHLIAAAPDLLEALEDHVGDWCDRHCTLLDHNDHWEECTTGRALIAKAKGQTP